ncbi:MAG: hypothetical protein KGJ36_06425 [Acidobacteriota bacterium]|nr:hypothetical protein [Acidobacteriota bacterium]
MLLNMLGVAGDDVVELASRGGESRDPGARVTMTVLVEVLLTSFASANPELATPPTDEGAAEPATDLTRMAHAEPDQGAHRDAA